MITILLFMFRYFKLTISQVTEFFSLEKDNYKHLLSRLQL